MIRAGIIKIKYSSDLLKQIIEKYYPEVKYISTFDKSRSNEMLSYSQRNLKNLENNIDKLITIQLNHKQIIDTKHIVIFVFKEYIEIVFQGFNLEIIDELLSKKHFSYIYHNYSKLNLRKERINRKYGYLISAMDQNWYGGEVLERIGKDKILKYNEAINIQEIEDKVFIQINDEGTPEDESLENRLKFRDYIDINNIL